MDLYSEKLINGLTMSKLRTRRCKVISDKADDSWLLEAMIEEANLTLRKRDTPE